MTIIRNIVSSVTTSIVDIAAGAIRRVLIQLDPVANSYYELAKPVTFAGDFEIEYDRVTPTATAQVTIGDADNLCWCRINADGSLQIKGAGTSSATSAGVTTFDNKMHSDKITRIGSDIFWYIDGVLKATLVNYVGDITFTRFGNKAGVNDLDGIISNVVLRDLDTPSNTQTFKLNQLNSDIEYSVGNVFGANLSDTPATTVPLPWVSNGGSSYSIDGTQTATIRVFYDGLLNANSAYSVEITTSNSTAGGVRPETAIIDLPFSVGNGVTSWVFQSTSNTNFNIEADPDFDGDVTYTIREITNAVTYENIGTGLPDRDTYTLVGGYWKGSDILSNGNFNNGATDWVIQSDWALVDGKVERTTGSVINRDITQSDVVTAGNTYEYSVDIVDYTSGNIDFWVGSSVPAGGSLGTHTTIVTPSISNFICFSDSAVGFIGSVDNLSAKRLIEPVITLPQVLIQLDPVANSHYELAKPVTFAGDFEIEVEFASTGDGVSQRIIASTSVNEGFDVYYDGGVRQVKFKTAVGGSFQFKANTDTAEKGKLHKILFSRTGDTFSLVINGGAPATQVRAGVAVDVGFFGCTSNIASFFDGIISNVVLRDLDTPSNTQTFKLNQLNSDIEYPVENVFGSELSSDVGFDDAAKWILDGWTVAGGKASISNAPAVQQLKTSGSHKWDVTSGVPFVVEIFVESVDGDVRFATFDTTGKTYPLYVGANTIIHTSPITGSRDFAIKALAGASAVITSMSARPITNAVTYENITQDLETRDTYTLVDGYWTGSDIVTQSIWENPITQGAQWAYDAGSNTWALVGDGNLSALQLIFTSLQPEILQVAGSVSGLTGDGLRLANSGTSVVIRQDGSYSEILDKATDAGQVFKRSTGAVNATITKPTIKRLIGAT